MPLSVSTDRLGATAMHCAVLLSRLKRVDRTGRTGPVAEVYPAAALHRWRLPSQGYKSADADARKLRREIVAGLEAGLGESWRPSAAERERLIAEHDLLDAFVAALVARAADFKRATLPRSDEERQLAEKEGWIRLPECSLGELVRG